MKNEGKREKFLLSFFIAVVFLLIVQYIASIYDYNMLQQDPKQFLLDEILGIEGHYLGIITMQMSVIF